jgi:hypothetical protein
MGGYGIGARGDPTRRMKVLVTGGVGYSSSVTTYTFRIWV